MVDDGCGSWRCGWDPPDWFGPSQGHRRRGRSELCETRLNRAGRTSQDEPGHWRRQTTRGSRPRDNTIGGMRTLAQCRRSGNVESRERRSRPKPYTRSQYGNRSHRVAVQGEKWTYLEGNGRRLSTHPGKLQSPAYRIYQEMSRPETGGY